MKKLTTLLTVLVLLVLTACSSSLKVELKEKIEIEYGSELKIENITDQKELSIKEIKDFDNKKVGEQKATITFTNEDEKETSKEVTLTVKDTKAPVIELKKDKVEITAGDKFDMKSNIKSVKDPVDGDVKYNDAKDLSKDGYNITGKIDTTKAGTYKLKVTAFDKNGNKAEKEYSVVVKEKPKEETSSNTQTNNYKKPTTNQSTSSSSNSSPSSSNNQQASTPAPSKIVCPRTGKEPEDPSKSCDAVLDWEGSNPQILFNSFEEANAWADDKLMNDPAYGIYLGYVASNICTNDGYCDWGSVSFY